NPLAGVADLVVNNGEANVRTELADRIRPLPGVKSANARIYRTVKLPDHDSRSVLLIGLDVIREMGNEKAPAILKQVIKDIDISEQTLLAYVKAQGQYFWDGKHIPVVVGKALDNTLPAGNQFLKVGRDKKNVFELVRVGPIDAQGTAAVLG